MDAKILVCFGLLPALLLGGVIFSSPILDMLSRCPRCGRWFFARKRKKRIQTYREDVQLTAHKAPSLSMPSKMPLLVQGLDLYECRYCKYGWGEPFKLDLRPHINETKQHAEITKQEADASTEVAVTLFDNHIPIYPKKNQPTSGCYLVALSLILLLALVVLIMILLTHSRKPEALSLILWPAYMG